MSPRNERLSPTNPNAAELQRGLRGLPAALRVMGYASLRKGQSDVVFSVLSGCDTICVLPTSTGKTACFVIPALAMGWKMLVFSPLVSLMRDQVQQLREDRGIAVAQISSGQSDGLNMLAAKQWAEGKITLLYVAPERLENKNFMMLLGEQRPDAITVDEAHCISQWSDTFRSSYCRIGDVVAQFRPKVVIALSATMPATVESDVRRVLRMENAKKVVYYYRRTNLLLSSSTMTHEIEVVDKVRQATGPAIIYCSSIKRVEELAQVLSNQLSGNVVAYHGDLSSADRSSRQDDFMRGNVDTMVATNAFGMGVDKPNVRMVLHRDMPGTIEALTQEIGRAGRDGQNSICHSFYSDKSLETQQFFLQTSYPDVGTLDMVYKALLRLRDGNGNVTVSLREVANTARVSSFAIQAVMHILSGAKVIERLFPDGRSAKCKIKTQSFNDPRFITYAQAIDKLGVPDERGVYAFDLDAVCAQAGVGLPTFRKYMLQFHDQGLVEFQAPPRVKTTRIIGDMTMVDTERLAHNAKLARKKLELVVQYFRVDDSEKHAYLEHYFNTQNELM